MEDTQMSGLIKSKKMKNIIFLISVLISAQVYGQEIKTIKTNSEVYWVLISNQDIKHGEYKSVKKKKTFVEGQYDNNSPIGVWKFYDSDGNLEQSYDYTNKILLVNNNKMPFSANDCKIDGTDVSPETLPVFIGGKSRYDRFIEENLKYPLDSKSKGIEGRQFIIINLSANGSILKFEIYRSISPDIDQEALRLISELPNEWIPAEQNGEKIAVSIALPVLFKLK